MLIPKLWAATKSCLAVAPKGRHSNEHSCVSKIHSFPDILRVGCSSGLPECPTAGTPKDEAWAMGLSLVDRRAIRALVARNFISEIHVPHLWGRGCYESCWFLGQAPGREKSNLPWQCQVHTIWPTFRPHASHFAKLPLLSRVSFLTIVTLWNGKGVSEAAPEATEAHTPRMSGQGWDSSCSSEPAPTSTWVCVRACVSTDPHGLDTQEEKKLPVPFLFHFIPRSTLCWKNYPAGESPRSLFGLTNLYSCWRVWQTLAAFTGMYIKCMQYVNVYLSIETLICWCYRCIYMLHIKYNV